MKRFASLTALLLTLVLVLSLAACGDKNTADDNQTTDQPSATQPADNGDAAQTNGATTGSVDLAALRDQLTAVNARARTDIHDMVSRVHGVFIVLNDNQRIPDVGQMAQRLQ